MYLALIRGSEFSALPAGRTAQEQHERTHLEHYPWLSDLPWPDGEESLRLAPERQAIV